MFRRSVRIACLVVGLLATAGLIYRALQDEDALNRERQSAAARASAVGQAAEWLLDLRVSMHAYVAPGQGLPFWAKRAQETIDQLRRALGELDDQLSPADGSLAESLKAVDELTAAERRARTYVSRGEMQLAGDVIFAEVRDLTTSISDDLQLVRVVLARADERRVAAIRQQQLMFAGAALGVWIAIALLMMPTEPKAAVKDPAEWRNELKETLKKPIPIAPDSVVAPPAPIVAAAPVPAAPETLEALKQVSGICAELSALADPDALEGTLARVNTVLNATGLIVWIASDDGATLSPVATHGFDPKLVERIGRINRDGTNLTATAFRENGARISPETAAAPAAIAVPMCSPTGPSGVLSVELKSGQSADDTKVAVSAIVAAQLATLAMPIPSVPAETIEEPRRAAL